MPISCSASRSRPPLFQNSIFTIISCQEGPSQKTQTSQQQTSPRQGQSTMSSTRTAHILIICTGMNNHSGSQKLQSFKAGVGHQMIHGKSIVTQTQCNNHVSQLTTCTIGNHTFYIILHKSHGPPHQTGHSSNPQQQSTCIHTTFPKPPLNKHKQIQSAYTAEVLVLVRREQSVVPKYHQQRKSPKSKTVSLTRLTYMAFWAAFVLLKR